MKRDEMIRIFKQLSLGQSFYGQLLATLNTVPNDEREAFFLELEAQHFSSTADLILYIETC